MRISDWSSDVCSSDLLTDQVFVFDQPDDHQFFELAGYYFLAVEEDVFDQLHGNCASAPFEFARFVIKCNGGAEGVLIKSLMSEEVAVFGCVYGVFHDRKSTRLNSSH